MPLTIIDDKVWYDEARKLEQICLRVAEVCRSGHSVLLLSHFESALASLARLLHAKGIDHERSRVNLSELPRTGPGKAWLDHARAFQVFGQVPNALETAPIEIIVSEHHPMYSRDQDLLDTAAGLICDATLTFYFSLDDPLMKYFGSDSVKALFERLGIDKSECISHPLVNRSIRQAQEKIEKKVGKDLAAQSAEDWFKYNLPEK